MKRMNMSTNPKSSLRPLVTPPCLAVLPLLSVTMTLSSIFNYEEI